MFERVTDDIKSITVINQHACSISEEWEHLTLKTLKPQTTQD